MNIAITEEKPASLRTSQKTPLMQQYDRLKSEYADALLFFQVGDFYELFFEDAEKASAFLAITLTKRGKSEGMDIPLCGIPVHALHHYLVKLIKGGFKVAIADQMTKPIPGQVVERKVTRYLTPGTLSDEILMDNTHPSYLSVLFPSKEGWGLLFTELLTAQTFITRLPSQGMRLLDAELIRFFPDEIIIPKPLLDAELHTFFRQKGYVVSPINSISEEEKTKAHAWIASSLNKSLQELFINKPALLHTMYILYTYVAKNHLAVLDNIKNVQFYEPDDFLILDSATQKNLEIIPSSGQKKELTLLGVVDKAQTAMGSRMIKKWLLRPLINLAQISERHQFVFAIKNNYLVLQKLREKLKEIADLERIIGRIGLKKAIPSDYAALCNSLKTVPEIRSILFSLDQGGLAKKILDRLIDFSPLLELLQESLNDDPRTELLIKNGFDFELDQLRTTLNSAEARLLALEQNEIQKTGLSALKLRYTDLYGYAFETTKAQSQQLPDYFILQQALSNKNRYVTRPLQELEQEINVARSTVVDLEKKVFERITTEVLEYIHPLRHAAHALATLDALVGFAYAAYLYHYTLPTFNQNGIISIQAGRHPVVEQTEECFVANNTSFATDEQVHIVTGPNMGGKSTYLRQVGLIHIMAHAGSLVPAKKADLLLLDRIFTRIGSGDDLARGKSTFWIEMEETGVICTQATDKSLVILDEVGRGTSTYDGMALAYAIIRYLATRLKTKALFATHYHELTELKNEIPGISNYHVAAEKHAHGLIFLHAVLPGASQGSFGIEVARLAQLPEEIISQAEQMLGKISHKEPSKTCESDRFIPSKAEAAPISITQPLPDPLITYFNSLHLDELSPRQALETLYELEKLIKKNK
jgi:DNA mismatch repair protein MutS